jgi:hypothetical protein
MSEFEPTYRLLGRLDIKNAEIRGSFHSRCRKTSRLVSVSHFGQRSSLRGLKTHAERDQPGQGAGLVRAIVGAIIVLVVYGMIAGRRTV